MKLKPYVMVGVLFVLIFLVTVFMFQSCGVWDPPGNRSGDDHDDDCDDTEIEVEYKEENNNQEVVLDSEYISDSLEGSGNLLEFLKENNIPVQCVGEGLGLTEHEMDATAGAIKSKLNIHMGDVRAVIDVCLGLEPREDEHDDEHVEGSEVGKAEKEEAILTESTEVVVLDETSSKSEIIEAVIKSEESHEPGEGSENDGEGRGQGGEGQNQDGEGQGSGDGGNNSTSDLPKLVGSDNISNYCETHNISKSCVAEKLGITEDKLDTGGGELSSELGIQMYELRDIVLSCS